MSSKGVPPTKPPMGEQMKVDAKTATEGKKKSKWGPFFGGLVVGLPVGLLTFLK